MCHVEKTAVEDCAEDDTDNETGSEGEEECHKADDEDSDVVHDKRAGMQCLPSNKQINVDTDSYLEYESVPTKDNGQGSVKKRYG